MCTTKVHLVHDLMLGLVHRQRGLAPPASIRAAMSDVELGPSRHSTIRIHLARGRRRCAIAQNGLAAR